MPYTASILNGPFTITAREVVCMRHKDKELMRRIREFAEHFYIQNGRSPSTAEIGLGVGVTKATVYNYLVEMNENGMLQYDGNAISTKRTDLLNAGITPAKVFLGSIPCGTPDVVEASVDEIVHLPTAIFGKGELCILHAQGESMIDAGIDDGDMVVVDTSAEATVGDIVVALDGEGQNTLKRLEYDNEKRCYYLHPENPALEDIYVNQLTVQGVARYVIKKLR